MQTSCKEYMGAQYTSALFYCGFVYSNQHVCWDLLAQIYINHMDAKKQDAKRTNTTWEKNETTTSTKPSSQWTPTDIWWSEDRSTWSYVTCTSYKFGWAMSRDHSPKRREDHRIIKWQLQSGNEESHDAMYDQTILWRE